MPILRLLRRLTLPTPRRRPRLFLAMHRRSLPVPFRPHVSALCPHPVLPFHSSLPPVLSHFVYPLPSPLPPSHPPKKSAQTVSASRPPLGAGWPETVPPFTPTQFPPPLTRPQPGALTPSRRPSTAAPRPPLIPASPAATQQHPTRHPRGGGDPVATTRQTPPRPPLATQPDHMLPTSASPLTPLPSPLLPLPKPTKKAPQLTSRVFWKKLLPRTRGPFSPPFHPAQPAPSA